MGGKRSKLDFPALVDAIRQADEQCAAQAGRAVNVSLTLRNWLIGRYISEFELHGADRAIYGERPLEVLSTELRKIHVRSCGSCQLYGYLTLYRTYLKILRSLSAEFRNLLPAPTIQSRIGRKVRTASAKLKVEGKELLGRISYSHFEQLIGLDEPLKRTFCGIECLRGNWSVRELFLFDFNT